MTNTSSKDQKRSTAANPTSAPCLSTWCSEVQSFAELEARIAALPTEQLRGAVFELFAKAYLSSMPESAADQVWRADAVPEAVRARFSGALDRDRGIDGVLRTHTGDLHAYQVKFRTGRQALSWSELSTFMGLTDEFDGRLVFTNSEEVASIVTKRRGLYCIAGGDLDRLSADDLRRIGRSLEGTSVERSVMHPVSHQVAALEDIGSELAAQDRATAVLACGTGKTLIGCWTAQRLNAQKVLVLVPSLALVRQTLHEWARALPQGSFVWQCVCSDSTVDTATDSWVLRQEDLDFPVTTRAGEVRRFLECDFPGMKVIFCTYHSAPVVAKGMNREQPFDLGIFDEAHRTAGRQGLRFSFALKNRNIPIRKRLFLTATPKHYDIRKRTRGGDLAAVYSMDDPATYGRVVHHLGVARAARKKIICPYKLVISVITDAEIQAEQLKRSEVIKDGETINAADLAGRLGLAKAVNRFDVAKLFTFHRSIRAARVFAEDEAAGIKGFLPGFSTQHIHGAMPMARRYRLLKEFSEASNALMSNARCLTEGVDAPEVDMVVFMTPKRSRIDIVQAIGRALRKAKGKQCGYVFVPVHLQNGESLDTAMQRADFEHIWEILQALQEQDTVLADCIRQMAEDVGRGRRPDWGGVGERIEVLAPEMQLEALKKAIAAACVKKLGSTWDQRYGQLRAFHGTHRHCLVTSRDDATLAAWVCAQRKNHRDGILSSTRTRQLSELRFEWDPIAAAWDAQYNALKAYKERHGHCNVPHRWSENRILGGWVAAQRRFHRQGRLPTERIQRLEQLGVVWDPAEALWQSRYQELAAFSKAHGHCDVPTDTAAHRCLCRWIKAQRDLKRQARLSEQRIRRLDELGLRWDPAAYEWDALFASLSAFHRQHGHCLVPEGYSERPGLWRWVVALRQQKQRGNISADRIARLDALGFVWNARELRWGNRVEQFAGFVRAHGHGQVPQSDSACQGLATWVVKQRRLKRLGRLSRERIRELKALGFQWEPHADSWDECYNQLLQLKQQGKRWNPPTDPKLAKWLKHQKHALKNGTLSPDRRKRMRVLLSHTV